MEALVVTLETARKLKAAGFPQRTYFVWLRKFPVFNDEDRVVTATEFSERLSKSILSPEAQDLAKCSAAPTAQEIADQLPHFKGSHQLTVRISYGVFGKPDSDKWQAAYMKASGDSKHITEGLSGTIAEALASLYLKLQETIPNGTSPVQDKGKVS